jgi:hypothetical protein
MARLGRCIGALHRIVALRWDITVTIDTHRLKMRARYDHSMWVDLGQLIPFDDAPVRMPLGTLSA